MDWMHAQLLGPLLGEELRREARRAALADMASRAARSSRASTLAIWLGRFLIAAGCRIDAAGRGASGETLAFLPPPCRHGT